jgi:hypothetical protein
VEVVQCQTELLQVVRTPSPGRGFTDLLDCRKEQPDEDGNDGNHYQQLDQGKGWPG